MVLVLELNRHCRSKVIGTVPERAEVEVEVGSRRVTRVAGQGDEVSLKDVLILDHFGALILQMIVCRDRAVHMPDEDGGPITRDLRVNIRIAIMVLDEHHLPTAGSPHVPPDRMPQVEGVRLAPWAMSTCRVVPVSTALPCTIVIKRKP